MHPDDDVRALAAEARIEAEAEAGADATPARLLAQAIKARGLKVDEATRGTLPEGTSARLDRLDRRILVDARLEQAPRSTALAHELGHHALHADARFEGRGSRYKVGDSFEWDCGYSSRSLAEEQADAYAAEFLCPRSLVRSAFVSGIRTPGALADALGLEPELVLEQAGRALLVPDYGTDPGASQDDRAPFDLCPTQRSAVEREGSMLVDGGPGTGKTTIIQAIARRLIASGASPASIAVLVHGDAAAEAFRYRMAAAHPSEAPMIWIGTPTSLGLEIAAPHAVRLGLSEDFRVIDATAALALVEERSPPNLDLPRRGLSRMVAQAVRGEKSGPPIDDVAAKAYAAAKTEAGCLVRADLPHKAVEVLKANADVASRWRRRFRHVLVDDCQEACAATVDIVRILAEGGATIVAAGDMRHPIRRFEGAQPEAFERLAADVGFERLRLESNRRNSAGIARAALHLAEGRCFDAVGPDLAVSRATTAAAARAAVRAGVVRLREKGVALRDQAVLAPTHTPLKSLAKYLTESGIPVLHFGEFHERTEVRDLLAVARLYEAGGDTEALARVSRLAIYGIPAKDVARVADYARRRGMPVEAALRGIDRAGSMPPRSRDALARLGGDLREAGGATGLRHRLASWVFASGYLEALDRRGPVEGPLARLAVHHVIALAREGDRSGSNGTAALSARLRRIGSRDLGGEYARLAPDRCNLEALRLITVARQPGARVRGGARPAARIFQALAKPSRG